MIEILNLTKMNIKSGWIIFNMGNNCSATVTVVRGHSRPEQIIPLQATNGNGNTNSISVGKEEEDDDDEDDDDEEDEEENPLDNPASAEIAARFQTLKNLEKGILKELDPKTSTDILLLKLIIINNVYK